MIKTAYLIKNTILFIENNIVEYDDQINSRMVMFDEVEYKNDIKNYIILNYDFVNVNINSVVYKINKKLEKTDLFPLLNNVISNIINDDNNIYMHSSIISKNGQGILLIGDFGQGKTTLGLIAEKYGYDINSADQSWLTTINKKLIMTKGSRYLKYETKENLLNKEKTNQPIEIKKILLLYGLCENGTVEETPINNNQHIIKKLFPYANWHSSIPLFTDNQMLYVNSYCIKSFLEKLIESNTTTSIIRGDVNNIMKYLKRKEEENILC